MSKFSDLAHFGHMGWVVDPLMEYLYVLDYLSQVTDIGQKFVKGGVIKGACLLFSLRVVRGGCSVRGGSSGSVR